jgi:methyl-accepting chemotaxis protein
MISRKNPVEGFDTNTIILLGMGTVLVGAIVYAIYEISEAKDTLSDTNDQIANASQTAQNVTNQATQAASQVGSQIGAATQTVQQVQQSPSVTAANSLAQWWNSI